MAEKNENKNGSAPGFAVAFFALACAALFNQDPFHESRPAESENGRHETSDIIQNVDARLWQDPFEAIDQYRIKDAISKKIDKSINPNFDNSRAPWLTFAEIHQSMEEKTGINSKNPAARKHIAFAVMLPDSPYFEDSETRRRLRYAVLSGFDAYLDYEPEDAEHIGYIKDVISLGVRRQELDIAYEWLNYKSDPVLICKESVPNHNSKEPATNNNSMDKDKTDSCVDKKYHEPILIMYLKSNQFNKEPHKTLTALFEGMKSDKDKWLFNVLGPASSDQLLDMTKEFSGFCKAAENKNRDQHIRIYSPRATVDEKYLVKNLDKDTPYPCQYNNLSEYFAKHGGFDFIRTTMTDDKLAQGLAQELDARDVKLADNGAEHQQHVVLISEKESLYGWHIGKSFISQIALKSPKCKNISPGKERKNCVEGVTKEYKDKNYIFEFSYFRGLDGEKLHKNPNSTNDIENDNSDSPASASNAAKEATRKKMEDADGDSQFDYIRRLAKKLERLDMELQNGKGPALNGKHGYIAAIGILGSDVYDKLLLLEAMHAKFPHVIFFTNVMDARYLHPDQNQWARNLVVLSGYDLELTGRLQKNIPPFRDSTQTAYFLTTQMALNDSLHETSDDPSAQQLQDILDNGWLKDPLIQEVGRTKSFNLPTQADSPSTTETLKPGLDPCPKFFDCPIQPEPNSLDLSKTQKSAILAYLILFFVILLLFESTRKYLGNPGFFVFIIYLLLAHIIYIYYDTLKNHQILYLLALYVSLIVLITIHNRFFKNIAIFTYIERYWLGINLSTLTLIIVIYSYYSHDILNSPPEEPIALLEGVSMWPAEGIRAMAWLLSGYFIFKTNLEYRDLFADNNNLISIKTFAKRRQWQWKLTQIWKAFFLEISAILALVFSVIYSWLNQNLGAVITPIRGKSIEGIDGVLTKFLLLPTFSLLFILVVAGIWAMIIFIQALQMELENHATYRCDLASLTDFKPKPEIYPFQLHEWVTIQIVGDLTRKLNDIVAYPFVVIAMMLLARISYFDNLITYPGLRLMLFFTVGLLFYSDYRFKSSAEEAEVLAFRNMHFRLVENLALADRQRPNNSGQLRELINISRAYAAQTFQPFLQRPIFKGVLLIMLALAIGYSDYSALAAKFID